MLVTRPRAQGAEAEALRLRPTRGEPAPARAREPPAGQEVQLLRDRHGDGSAERRVRLQDRVYTPVDGRHGHPRERRDSLQPPALDQPSLESADVGLRRLLVAVGRDDVVNGGVDPAVRELVNGCHARIAGRHPDDHLGRRNPAQNPDSLLDDSGSVLRHVRSTRELDQALLAPGPPVAPAQPAGRGGDMRDDQPTIGHPRLAQSLRTEAAGVLVSAFREHGMRGRRREPHPGGESQRREFRRPLGPERRQRIGGEPQRHLRRPQGFQVVHRASWSAFLNDA